MAAHIPFLARRSPSPPLPLHDTESRAYADDDTDAESLHSLSSSSLANLVSASAASSEPGSPPPPYNEEKTARWARRHRPNSALRRLFRDPKCLAIAAILLFLIAFGVFAALYVSNGDDTQTGLVVEHGVTAAAATAVDAETTAMKTAAYEYVLGAPTESFKDNLRNDTQYITAFIAAGWTNDFMTYANLLYLALLSGRVAVLPPFQPSHLSDAAGYPPFSDIFDIPRLSRAMRLPIIEWQDLKDVNSTGTPHMDELGCWSIWATSAEREEDKRPRGNKLEGTLGLDVSYTPIPETAIMLPQFPNDPHTRFGDIAALTFPDGRRDAHLPAQATFPGPYSGHTALPDEQMACFDFPYYLADWRNFEFFYDYSPAWRFVGTHAHWTSRIEDLAFSLVRETLHVPVSDPTTPPYISIHVRHGDFKTYCEPGEGSGCFAPLDVYRDAVEEVKRELREKEGVEVEHVIVTSDESDVEWWMGVREMGWTWVDHEARRTVERFGLWYPVFLDAAVQSLGAGFVGTDRSTMSLIAERRVRDWQGGPTRAVQWGHWNRDKTKTKRDGDGEGERRAPYAGPGEGEWAV